MFSRDQRKADTSLFTRNLTTNVRGKSEESRNQKNVGDRAESLTGVEPDQEQRRIIESENAVIQVSAYAGTGKTTVIALSQRRKVGGRTKASDFLALTFTRTGRNALKKDLLGGTEIRTLHSFARWLVKRERGSVPRLLTEEKELALIRTAVELEAEKLGRGRRREALVEMVGSEAAHRSLATFFAQLAASGRSAKAFVEEPGSRYAAARPYLPALELVGKRLRKLKKRLHVTTFADMIGPAIEILKKRPSLPFRHLMVDEWQDCPPDQAQLVHALIPLMASSLVVGDRHQNVYGFAGARFGDLRDLIPGAVEMLLTHSYRLSEAHARLATSVLRQGHPDAPPVIGKRRGRESRPKLIRLKRAEDQAGRVVALVRGLLAKGVEASEIAIVGRTRAHAMEVERALLAVGVETSPSYRKKRLGLIFVALRLLRQMEKLKRRIEPVTPSKLRQHAMTAQVRSVLNDVCATEHRSAKTDGANLRRLKGALREGQSLESRLKVCIQVLISRQGGRKKLGADGQDELHRWEPWARQFTRSEDLRRHVRKMNKANGVALSTIHAAKGLQYEHVVVLNVIDGGLPHYTAQAATDVDQERNLFYVAVTRAFSELYVIEAPCRHPKKSNTLFAKRSPFLADQTTRGTFRKLT